MNDTAAGVLALADIKGSAGVVISLCWAEKPLNGIERGVWVSVQIG